MLHRLNGKVLQRQAWGRLRESRGGGAEHVRGGDRSGSQGTITLGGEGGVPCLFRGHVAGKAFNAKYIHVCVRIGEQMWSDLVLGIQAYCKWGVRPGTSLYIKS